MQLQPRTREEAWDEAAGPPIGERVSCLDQFLHYNGDKTTAMWRPAVVVEYAKEGDVVQEIKVHFEGFSDGYDKWISWPRERNRFASLGTSGSRTPSVLAEGSFDGPAARSSDTDSRRNSSVGGDGSCSTGTGTAVVTRRKGFSRLKVFGAIKGLVRSRGNSSTEGRTPTLTPRLAGPPGSSFSAAKVGEGRGPAEAAALAALCFEDHECKQEEKDEGTEESKRCRRGEEGEGVEEEKASSVGPAPPSPSIVEEEESKQQEQQEEAAATTGGGGGSGPSSPLSYPVSAAATAADDDGQREDLLPLLAAATAGEGSSSTTSTTSSDSAPPAAVEALVPTASTTQQTPPPEATVTAEQTPSPSPAAAAVALSVTSSPFSSDVDLAAGVVEEEGKSEWRGPDSAAAASGREDDETPEVAAAELMQETARNQPIRELTPHLVEELEGEGAGFTLTVFKNNKRDRVPVPLVCGKYTTAYEADRAAEAFSSPVWHEPTPSSRCAECQSAFRAVLQRRRHHCRNCGRLVCTTCALRFWPKSMLPHSYRIDSTERRVRVCRTCYSAGKKFRRALLQGSYLGATEAYSTGCVNLRVPCSHFSEELPVHCAAAGGNVSLLSWLIEDRCCPIFIDENKTVALLDAKGRSVMAAAAESGQIETMRYLAFTQPSAVTNVGDETLWRGLQACLRYDEDNDNNTGGDGGGGGGSVSHQVTSPAARGGKSCYKLGDPSDDSDNDSAPAPMWANGASDLPRLSNRPGTGIVGGGSGGNHLQAALDMSTAEAGYNVYDLPGSRGGGGGGGGGGVRRKNSCIVCFRRKVNATLVPCGHHCCCMPCTEKFELCPVCRVRVTKKIKAIDG